MTDPKIEAALQAWPDLAAVFYDALTGHRAEISTRVRYWDIRGRLFDLKLLSAHGHPRPEAEAYRGLAKELADEWARASGAPDFASFKRARP